MTEEKPKRVRSRKKSPSTSPTETTGSNSSTSQPTTPRQTSTRRSTGGSAKSSALSGSTRAAKTSSTPPPDSASSSSTTAKVTPPTWAPSSRPDSKRDPEETRVLLSRRTSPSGAYVLTISSPSSGRPPSGTFHATVWSDSQNLRVLFKPPESLLRHFRSTLQTWWLTRSRIPFSQQLPDVSPWQLTVACLLGAYLLRRRRRSSQH